MSKVWEWSSSEGNARMVMLALADFCDDDGLCCPGIARIAKKCRISERSVQRVMAGLVELGELVKMEGEGLRVRGPRGDGFTNAYKLILKGVTESAGLKKGGDNIGNKGVTELTEGGDTAMSPNPSGEPSVSKPSVADKALEIYQVYPKKTGKPEALRQIRAALKTVDLAHLLERTRAYAAAVALWPADERCFVPDPERWFKKGRWEDDPRTWERKSAEPEKPKSPSDKFREV